MIISRRQLLGLILTTGAAGTLLTDQAVANAIKLVPVDPITEVVRRGREVVLAHQIDKDPRNPITTTQFNDLCAFMRATFTEKPHQDDACAFFDGYLFPALDHRKDYLNETDLRVLGEPLVPFVVLRTLLMKHRVNLNITMMPEFCRWAEENRELVIGYGSPEYSDFAENARRIEFSGGARPRWIRGVNV